MSPLLEDFFSRCFIRDESARGTCAELLKHPWIVKFKVRTETDIYFVFSESSSSNVLRILF